MTEEEKTFIKVTNKEIYSKLEEIERKLNFIEQKTKIAFWMSSTALTIALLTIGALLSWKL